MLYYVLAAAILFFILGFLAQSFRSQRQVDGAEKKASQLIDDARLKEKDLLLKAQDKAIKLIDDAKKEESSRRKEINRLQSRLESRENAFSQKLLDLQDKQQKLYDKVNEVQEIKERIKKIQEEQILKLEEIADLSQEEAKEEVVKKLEESASDDLMLRLRKMEDYANEELEEKARNIMSLAMQRMASNHTVELTTTIIDLPNDEMKGRVIGREGRNIKAIEQLTGVEIIVDDTPNVITISGFSLIRRHIAKKTLEYLIKDGRIHPSKIEDAVELAKKDLIIDIKKAGEEAMYAVGVTGFDPKLVQILGRLKYRTSYGQNVLAHSVEVAHLAAIIAEELGSDVTLAKKGALLHDIGKAVDHEVKGNHTEIGRDIAEKYGLSQDIIEPILGHHDDNPKTLSAVIVKVADAISSARPGARNDSHENYIQRLEELEKIATSFEGIEKAYAIQAGREVRVFVNPENTNDFAAHKIAKNIAKKIEEELKYPGEIKVNVIRETRVIEYAR